MRKRGEKRKGQKLKKKVEESKNKAKLEKSQPKKGKCDVNNEENASTKGEDDEDSAIFPKCGFVYPNEGDVWVCCNSCEAKYDLKYNGYAREEDIPNLYYCFKCL